LETPCSAEIFLFEGFRLDRRGLFRRDESAVLAPVEIGSRALDILGALLQKPGYLVSRGEIMAAAWPGTVVEDHNLTVQISALRRVLDQDRAQDSCIQTVPGRGYRFVAPVTRVGSATEPAPELFFGNGSDRPIAEKGQSQNAVAPGRMGNTNLGSAPTRARRQIGGVMAALIGAVGLVLAAAVGIGYSLWSGGLQPAPRLSIVVLPFSNLSNDPDQQYFADALTEDLTTDLSRIRDMLVISRNTAFTYRNSPTDTRQIGRELRVRYVLEGSVQRSGSKIRVAAQLIDAATDVHLWAERFDREIGDLFTLQDEVTSQIANALGVEMIGREAARPTENPDALDYILRGRAAGAKGFARENTAEAISLFERALALDPQSVEAQSRLAAVLIGRVIISMTDTAAADVAGADGLIAQALAASPHDWFAHWVKGQVLRAQHRCEEALPEFEAALAINRNEFMTGLAWCKLHTGSIEEVIPLMERAIRLSPRDPGIGFLYGTIGFVHLLESRTDEAIIWLEKARSALPGLPHAYLISAYALKGDTERASAELAEARRLRGQNFNIARLRAAEGFGAPKFRTLFETTYLVGLREAGVPEE
jgi:TolB-like protein/DNA-binding winged helix-turn-helix (wHTH) protein